MRSKCEKLIFHNPRILEKEVHSLQHAESAHPKAGLCFGILRRIVKAYVKQQQEQQLKINWKEINSYHIIAGSDVNCTVILIPFLPALTAYEV